MLGLSIIITFILSGVFFFLIYLSLKKWCKISKRGICADLKFTGKFAKVKKIFAIVLIIFIGASIICCCHNISNRFAFLRMDISGHSEWRDSNGQKYLYVEANNHYDLGYQTGYALSDKIFAMKALLVILSSSFGLSYFDIEKICNEYDSYIPENYKQEILGMSEGATAGCGFLISYTDILVQSVFIEALYGRHIPSELSIISDFGCTALGAINNDGSVLVGQNMDLIKPMGSLQSFVLHKLGNDPLVFTHRLGGCLASPLGKNEYGLVLTVNLVQTKEIAQYTVPTFVLVREGLVNEKNIEGLYNTLFPNNSSSYSHNYIIANSSSILAVQALPHNITKIYAANLVVFTNTFLNPFWQDTLLDPQYSKERQSYAEALLLEAYEDNKLTEIELIKILGDEPIICRNEGGLLDTGTVSYMTSNSFGIGTPNGHKGSIPI